MREILRGTRSNLSLMHTDVGYRARNNTGVHVYTPAIHLRGRPAFHPMSGRVNEIHVPFEFSREDVMSSRVSRRYHRVSGIVVRAIEIADVTLVRDADSRVSTFHVVNYRMDSLLDPRIYPHFSLSLHRIMNDRASFQLILMIGIVIKRATREIG